jgi:predicted  nucleic acid-binding Zn-ribbon protein
MAQVKDFSIQEKLVSLVTLQQIDSKLDEIKILKGELPMEVADLEDEITGLHARLTRIEEEVNGVTEFIEQRKLAIKAAEAQIAKYEKQSENVKNNRKVGREAHQGCYRRDCRKSSVAREGQEEHRR